MAAKGFQPSPPLVQKCGALLISTLTSLKHAGAAFAARDSLEGITQMCLRSEDELLRKIPQGWVDRLLGEMCSAEKVRDSTLRRSTGYALGVLALMRSELMTRTARSSLCDHILRCLVAYSLPAERDLQVAMSTLNYVPDEENGFSGVFSFCNGSDGGVVLPDSEYEVRCRETILGCVVLKRTYFLSGPCFSRVVVYMH